MKFPHFGNSNLGQLPKTGRLSQSCASQLLRSNRCVACRAPSGLEPPFVPRASPKRLGSPDVGVSINLGSQYLGLRKGS